LRNLVKVWRGERSLYANPVLSEIDLLGCHKTELMSTCEGAAVKSADSERGEK